MREILQIANEEVLKLYKERVERVFPTLSAEEQSRLVMEWFIEYLRQESAHDIAEKDIKARFDITDKIEGYRKATYGHKV